MSKATDTRHVYRIEDTWQHEEWPIDKLRELAHRVWRREAHKSWRVPKIVAGRGTKYGGRLLSYCIGRSYIELSRQQRDPKVLLHELAHALVGGTVCGHNVTFQRKLIYLLRKYRIRVALK
jgi:hypothetical protein